MWGAKQKQKKKHIDKHTINTNGQMDKQKQKQRCS